MACQDVPFLRAELAAGGVCGDALVRMSHPDGHFANTVHPAHLRLTKCAVCGESKAGRVLGEEGDPSALVSAVGQHVAAMRACDSK